MTPESLVKMQALPVGLLLFSVTWAAPALSEDCRTSDKGSIHGASVYPEPMEGKGTEEGDTLLNLPAQERYSAALKASIMQAVKRPDTATKLPRDRNEEKKPKSVLNVIPADAINDAKNGLKGAENQRKYLPSPNSSAKSEGTHRTRRSAHYPKHLPKPERSPATLRVAVPQILKQGGITTSLLSVETGSMLYAFPAKEALLGQVQKAQLVTTGGSQTPAKLRLLTHTGADWVLTRSQGEKVTVAMPLHPETKLRKGRVLLV